MYNSHNINKIITGISPCNYQSSRFYYYFPKKTNIFLANKYSIYIMKILITSLVLLFAGSNICSAQFVSGDDKLHLAAGALISATTYTIVYTTTKNKKKAFWYSLGVSALAGLTKELIDVSENERFDTGEIAATTLGGLTASMTINLFVGKKKKKQTALVTN